MSQNIEIKAKVDLSTILEKVKTLTPLSSPQIIFQEDIFFNSDSGRLKLRKFSEGNSELIYYKRENTTGPKTSNYEIYRPENSNELENFLNNSFGKRGIVKKKRTLYLHNNTRIHLDEVEYLGTFLELEVMVIDNYSLDDCKKIAEGLIKHLNISKEMLIDKAYIDILEAKNKVNI